MNHIRRRVDRDGGLRSRDQAKIDQSRIHGSQVLLLLMEFGRFVITSGQEDKLTNIGSGILEEEPAKRQVGIRTNSGVLGTTAM